MFQSIKLEAQAQDRTLVEPDLRATLRLIGPSDPTKILTIGVLQADLDRPRVFQESVLT